MPKYESLSQEQIQEVIQKRKEYLQKYRDAHKEKLKQWKEDNKKHLDEYREKNKENLHEYYINNKEKYKLSCMKYRQKTTICECGCEIKSYYLNNHKFTKKHLNALKSIHSIEQNGVLLL